MPRDCPPKLMAQSTPSPAAVKQSTAKGSRVQPRVRGHSPNAPANPNPDGLNRYTYTSQSSGRFTSGVMSILTSGSRAPTEPKATTTKTAAALPRRRTRAPPFPLHGGGCVRSPIRRGHESICPCPASRPGLPYPLRATRNIRTMAPATRTPTSMAMRPRARWSSSRPRRSAHSVVDTRKASSFPKTANRKATLS